MCSVCRVLTGLAFLDNWPAVRGIIFMAQNGGPERKDLGTDKWIGRIGCSFSWNGIPCLCGPGKVEDAARLFVAHFCNTA
ncbi:hypothetical protein JMJ77_0014742 [Colletotrichum scovillei]|uniref:Uncharacterized protein n=1 Tax=Colletotrichum scovillei TaxID=1209932 RepID=A0A9P7R104_9PEZI|nr:hypothetical protein JMJ77_0014742 [Colletotrichum scovillei]KAG7056350.1 hypothetical protein JMJ78_0000152 [Colletotrichum scovillei]KAG7066282.1 hypothetical protein JMJ76_0000147 [Colletotrichum scovillei]